MAKRQHVGTFKPPKDFARLSPQRKRAFSKCVADAMRERAGLAPTDARGNAPKAK